MKLIMLSGFLGAGKTSCVLSLGQYLTAQPGDRTMKLAVIENEVAAAGVDNNLLEKNGLAVTTLASGCICCTLNVDLITTLNRLSVEYDPEYVVFEPSGVANPEKIWETIKEHRKDLEKTRQITVVDAVRWRKIRTVSPALALGQVKGADAIFLNKCDLTEERIVGAAEQDLRKLNPHAKLYRTKASEGIMNEIWGEVL